MDSTLEGLVQSVEQKCVHDPLPFFRPALQDPLFHLIDSALTSPQETGRDIPEPGARSPRSASERD